VIQRGNNRQACFGDESDYKAYLTYLKESALQNGVAIHAYVLMTNKLYNRMDLPSDWDVHHIFPKNFVERFQTLGVWVKDPRLLVPLPNRFHQLMHSNGYNVIWERFIGTNPSRDQILDKAKQLAEKFEFSEYLGGYF
jgi:REP element-mobilizing transposase RayT